MGARLRYGFVERGGRDGSMKRINLLPQKRLAIFPDWSLVEISDRTQDAFVACAAAIALLSITAFLETKRIVQAQTEYTQAKTHLNDVLYREENIRTVAQALSSFGVVARNVESTRSISHLHLMQFAHVGDLLPDGIWISDLVREQGQITMKGHARNAALLGEAMRNIANDHAYHDPQLVAAREHDENGTHCIDFELSIGLTEKD